MGWWQSFVEKAKKSIKLSVTDPSNFQELWSVTSTRIRLISLFIVLIFALGIGMSLLVSWLGGPGLVGGNKSIERKQLEEQYETIAQLTEDLNVHKKYVAAVRRIYSGEVPVESNLDSLVEDIQLNEEVRTEPSAPEKEISKKVKDAMRTGNQESRPIPYFSAPVSGVVSDTYQGKTHPGIDIVTEKDASVQACLSGTVVYSGYSREDGYILIMDHGNGYISI
jgi:murein DD-endopeptidase MepM/ murein hydrolase activator NlpD